VCSTVLTGEDANIMRIRQTAQFKRLAAEVVEALKPLQ
jgi:hypothetical protein